MGKNSNARSNSPSTNKLLKLELAVKDLMKNFDDNNIHGLVNCIIRGWIQQGRFTDEYRRLTELAIAEMAAAEEASRSREQAFQDSIKNNAQAQSIIVDTTYVGR